MAFAQSALFALLAVAMGGVALGLAQASGKHGQRFLYHMGVAAFAFALAAAFWAGRIS